MKLFSLKFEFLPLAVASLALLIASPSLYAQEADAGDEDEIEEEEEKRDPFWPVGYVSVAEKKRIADEEAKAAAELAKRKEEEAKRLERRRLQQQADANKNVKAPAPVVEEVPEPDWIAAVNKLKISGYAEKNGARSCLIAGQPVTEGMDIALVYNGFRYVWKVKVIGPQKKDMRFVRVSAEQVQ